MISWLNYFDWLDWLGLAIIVVLLGLLAFLIWRRKHPRTADKLKVPIQPSMPANRLLQVWRTFIRSIPWRLRSNVSTVPFSLIIGEAGGGKTEIVNQYADWQGQNFRFQPSAINDALLQIYQGSEALVLEFSAALLYDTQPATYQAIKKLWQRLPTNPQAVVVIDATTLLKPNPDALRLFAQALSGKLKVFSELERRPLPLVLALSHMEKVTGFVEFCVFLEKIGLSLQVEFPERDGVAQLAGCLESFQLYLKRALVNCSAPDFLKIVAFLNEAPRLLGVLSEFLHVAGLDKKVSALPVVRLCLLSNQVHSFGCNPFKLQPRFVASSSSSLPYHAKVALALMLIGSSYLGGSYFYQKWLLEEVLEGIKTVRITPIEFYPEKISPLFLDFSTDLNKNPLLSFQHNFFPHILVYSNHLLIREIRNYYLIPLLKQAQFEPDTIFKTNKLLAILYATANNEMGELVLHQLQEKPTDYMIKHKLLIYEYVMNNAYLNELDKSLNELDYTSPAFYNEKQAQLLQILQSFERVLEKPFIQAVELKGLNEQTVTYLKFIDDLNSHTHELMIMRWLQSNTNLSIDLQSNYDKQVELRQKPLEELLRLISQFSLDDTSPECPSTVSINQCLKQVQAVAKAGVTKTSSTMEFTLDGNRFSYSTAQWVNVMTRSRLSIMLRDIIHTHKTYDGWIFFDSPTVYSDIEMNSSNNGEALFAGKAKIDGRLSAEAFEKEVKPAVVALSTVIANLPIEASEKKYFNHFVLDNLRVYSDNYASAYLNYFRQFQVRINSAWALNYIIDQMLQPNSALLQTLVQIKTNTALDLSASSNFQPFAQKLLAFRFVQHLMEEKNGVYPEFQKYQSIMSQMQTELNSREPYLPKKTDGDAGFLKGAITPMGRMAWATRINEDGAYSNLVKSWLQNSGIPPSWQQPFLAPVQKVAELGTAEIRQTIEGIWLDIWNTNITPLLGKFPFSPNAGRDKELTPDDLIKTFHPKQGVFWLTFQQYLAPLCTFNNGVWVKRHELSESLALTEKTLSRVNAVQQLTASLWDAQGMPKSLQVIVKPGLLPVFDAKRIPNAPLASLIYLRSGGASTLGFNQQVVWQKLPLDWWVSQPAEVGMEFRKGSEVARVYSNTSITDSQWNFFRLLQQGKSTGNNHYQWLLAHPEFPQQPLNLEFIFQSAPWAVFTNLAGS